ncbi:MAG: GNAT family N-acetyltransferase [Acidobacteria bacterium]|nr:GNAT family N-acetyltransferase [Acidobacteriota bacterium]
MDKTVELKTERLLLRPFRKSDADDVLAYNQDPEMGRYAVGIQPLPYSRETVERLVAMFADPPEGQGILQMFAIELEGQVIGEIVLNQWEEYKRNQRADLSYTLARPHWNKGLTTEAARTVMDWAFNTQDIYRLCAWCDPRNTSSWRVMEKLGMKREGLLRSHLFWNGEYRDQLWYGILRPEWEKLE